ncbi:MAG: DUF4465 domain-containing protein [Crocinitomicaceae bacterium]|nr:DUF4465 domain-containing protein [Crocinitomicaceae bacterium]
MKKIYLSLLSFTVTISLQAQVVTVDFEDLTLPSADTFNINNGNDGLGSFTSNGVTFTNSLETFSWGFMWSGFAYSNITDNTTAGISNQFSAFPGSGAEGSNNYVIFYPTDTLSFDNIVVLPSAAFTNTTYAGLSMRDGDMFAKQFGSPFDASGDEDGTEGKDYFFVTLYGWDQNWQLTDSVEIFLADFRDEDTNNHYILDTWEDFDLYGLGMVQHLTFKFSSSDVGPWGINTPVYFAMDNLKYQEVTINTNEENTAAIRVYPNPVQDNIYVSEAGELTIYDATGKIVLQNSVVANQPVAVNQLHKGAYIIHFNTANNTFITRRIVKI